MEVITYETYMLITFPLAEISLSLLIILVLFTSQFPQNFLPFLYYTGCILDETSTFFFSTVISIQVPVNFQMFKLVLEKAEEPEIKLPTSAGSSKKQEGSRKTSISALLTVPKPLTMCITTTCGKFLKR